MAAADVPPQFAVTAIGVFAPGYSDPVATDAHRIGPDDQNGIGARVDGRYRLLPWFALGVGIDYLVSTHDDPSKHLGIPFIVSFVPLRTERVELAASLGVGPAWSAYKTEYSTDGTLRGSEVLLELRVEPAFVITRQWAVVGSLGARVYGWESFSNPVSYAAYGPLESPASAIDVGVGARLCF